MGDIRALGDYSIVSGNRLCRGTISQARFSPGRYFLGDNAEENYQDSGEDYQEPSPKNPLPGAHSDMGTFLYRYSTHLATLVSRHRVN